MIQTASKRLLLESPKIQFHTSMHTPAQLCAVTMHFLNHFKDLMLLCVQMSQELLVSYVTILFSCAHCCTA